MEPEQKKEWIKTALLAAAFIVVALVMLKLLIGDPSAMPTPTE